MTPLTIAAAVAKIAATASLLALAACATVFLEPAEPDNPPRKETFYAVTATNQLISFNAGQPQKILSRKALTGLQADTEILGIDYRVAKGVLFALGRAGSESRLYTVNTASGVASPVGSAALAITLTGNEFAFDFNPVADRIRVVSNSGQNLRLHPDTGAVVDANPDEPGIQLDGKPAYPEAAPEAYPNANADINAGKTPAIVGAAYTYNKRNDKITTNYAIDANTESLVTQGSKEGVTPVISPNTGKLFTVGKLGAGPFVRASFDIADTTGAAFVAVTRLNGVASKLYLVNLDNGSATFLGTIGGGETIRGMSFEP